ncbi:MAG: transporter substrate-binding domain-containing protein, partial [Chloroflexota bacterium]
MVERIIRFRSLLFLVLVLVSCTKEPDTSSSLQVTATPTLELPDVTPIPPKEKLIAAFDNSFPPFSDTNPSGELVGMDLDVLRVIADGAEMELSPVPMVWEAALEKLYSGEVHLLAGGITDSDFASEQVLYSEPYLDLDIKAVVLAESRTIVDVNQLPGLIVGLKSSSLAWETTGQLSGFLEIPPGNVRKYNDLRELMDALFAGQVDAIIINQIAFSEFDEANPSLLRVLNSNGSQDGDGSLGHYQFRFAVSPGGTETLALLNHGIKTLEQSGYIDDIAQSWGLSVEFGERPRFAQDAKAGSLIAGIEKVDDFTVRFVLNHPDPYFDYRLSVPSTAIQSPANLQLLSRSGQLS